MSVAAHDRPIIEIGPADGWRGLDLRELYQHRELLAVLVWRDVKVRYRQTLLGVMWVVAQPLLTMAIFTVLFNQIARIPADRGTPYPLFVMAALVPWTFFSSAVNSAANSLIGNANLISKVYFPRMIIPAASVLSGLVDAVVTGAIVIAMAFWYSAALGPAALLLPVMAIVIAAFAFGCGLWLSSMNVRYRDVRVLIPFFLQIWMYATPVVYPAGTVPPRYRWISQANPMTGLIEGFRAALLNHPIPWNAVAYSVAAAAVVVITGALYFRRAERLFADIL